MSKLILLIFFVAVSHSSAEKLLLTGSVFNKNSQVFVTPWTSRWQTQIKWMKEEGTIAEPGDVVVVFDTSDMSSTVEQKKNALRQAEQQATNELIKREREFKVAKYDLENAKIKLKKATIEAEVPIKFRSEYEYAQFQFEALKAKEEQQQAKKQLALKEQAYNSEKKKQTLKIQALKQDLQRSEQQLESMSLTAEMTGPVFYASHPWNGSKISQGSNVQTTMKVASISGTGQVEDNQFGLLAWLNEVDYPKVSIGSKVSVYFDSDLSQSIVGTIKKISTQSEVKSQWGSAAWYAVTVELDDIERELMPGMSAFIEVTLEKESEQ
jgi:multidrug resistance efflux pump